MAALDYSNEQKQKRSVVRTVLFSATVVGLGLCKFWSQIIYFHILPQLLGSHFPPLFYLYTFC